MTTINVNVSRPSVQILDLGLQKENIVESIVFDISSWIAEYGDGVAYIYAQRRGDAAPYPVELTINGGTATWTLTNTDTAIKGKGKAQLVYTVDEKVKKTIVYPTFVHNSLGASAEPPDPYEDWLEVLGGYTARIELADLDAKAMKLASEGFAVGEQDGEEVPSSSVYYQNNAKFYSQLAQQGADESGFALFRIDENNGQIYVTVTDNLDDDITFSVNEEDGTLEVIAND